MSATLLLDAVLRRQHRPDLAERLRPYQPTVADEAEGWLRGKCPVHPSLGEEVDVVMADIRTSGTVEPETEDYDWLNEDKQASAIVR